MGMNSAARRAATISLTALAPALAASIIELLEAPAQLDAMEVATDSLFAGDSAARIVEECERLIVGI